MADIDLKTETPDGSLPSDGFLFGADSQSAASPSVYTTQAVATTLLGSTSLTGATLTASSPVLNLSQTWNNAAVTFTGLRFNVTDTASAAGSLLMDLQVGGASRFRVSKSGIVTGPASATFELASSTGQNIALNPGAGGGVFLYSNNIAIAQNSANFGWLDVPLSRRAAANLRLGAADAAAPVAQTLSVQSVSAGTSNTAGQNFTITGSQGTGNAAGGSIVFQVAPAGSSGTAQNALATALTINSASQVVFADGSNSLPSIRGSDADSGMYFFGNNIRFSSDGGNKFSLDGNCNLNIAAETAIRWTSSASNPNSGPDTILVRDGAANTLALRNGTSAQTLNIYNTYTDASNYERLRIFAQSAGSVIIGTQKAGTGVARALELQTDGTTRLSFSADNSLAVVSSTNLITGTQIRINNATRLTNSADGVLQISDSSQANFGRLQFGGTTSSFPALKRSTTSLQARLADDSDFTNIQGKLTTETAYTAGAPTATGYIVLYDSTGTAYKIPAEAL